MSAQSVVPSLAWYWNRLRRMSPSEIAYRTITKTQTILEQAGWRVASRPPNPDLSPASTAFLSAGKGIEAEVYRRTANAVLGGKLEVFALECEFDGVPNWNRDPKIGIIAPLAYGKTLDYRNAKLVGDIKYLWEPNRHLHLATLAQAFALTRDDRYSDAIQRHLESWIEQCPYLKGPNWSSSLELAIRLFNWSIVWQLIGGADSRVFQGEAGRQFRDRWLSSVYQHMHFILGHRSGFSSANNHLIGELAGLYVGAVTWPFWPEAARWSVIAKRQLEKEALAQNGPDGVNREQAVSYQQFVLDFLLIAALTGRANGQEFAPGYWQRMERMLEYLASIMDVDGHVPMIGDADDGYAVRLSQEPDFCPYRSLLATGAILFRRGDFKAKAGGLDDKTRWLLPDAQREFDALTSSVDALPVRREFPDGGYYVLGCDFETEREVRAVVDAGALGYLSIAAHGHADALAVTLSVGGREFLIDPGTYAYHTGKVWRDYFRGTAAHNTIVVDGEDQSVIGGNFMWLRHAVASCELWESNITMDRLVGSHNGYTRLSDSVRHRREIVLTKSERRFLITDTLECQDNHRIECYWHFSEDCVVSTESNKLTALNDGKVVRLTLSDPALRFETYRGETEPPRGWVSRRFDVKVPTTTVRVALDIKGTTSLKTEIICEKQLSFQLRGV